MKQLPLVWFVLRLSYTAVLLRMEYRWGQNEMCPYFTDAAGPVHFMR